MELKNFTAKGVIWDFDGTVLDSFKLHEIMMHEMTSKRGLPKPSPALLTANYHGHLRDSLHGITGLSGESLDELYEDFIQSEEHFYENPLPLYFADALNLMKRSQAIGLKQIIVSNRSHYSDSRKGSPRNLAAREPLQGLINAVVCGDDNAFYKPDARMLDRAEIELGLKRDDLIVIGDQFADAELAHNLGVQAILIQRGSADIHHLDKLPDGWQERTCIVEDLSEVSIRLK